MASLATGIASGYFPPGGALMGNGIFETIKRGLGVDAGAMFENIAVAPPVATTKETRDVIVDALDASITRMEEKTLQAGEEWQWKKHAASS